MNFVKKFLNQDYSGYLVHFQLGWDENDSLIFKLFLCFPPLKKHVICYLKEKK